MNENVVEQSLVSPMDSARQVLILDQVVGILFSNNALWDESIIGN